MCETPEEFATFTQGTITVEAALRRAERGHILSQDDMRDLAGVALRTLELAPRDLNPECRENLEAAIALAPIEELQHSA